MISTNTLLHLPPNMTYAVCDRSLTYLWHSTSWKTFFNLSNEISLIGKNHLHTILDIPQSWLDSYEAAIKDNENTFSYKPIWYQEKAFIHSASMQDDKLVIFIIDVTETAIYKRSLYTFQDNSLIGKAIIQKVENDCKIVYWNRYASTVKPGINLEGCFLSDSFFHRAQILNNKIDSLHHLICDCLAKNKTKLIDLYDIETDTYFLVSVFPLTTTEIGLEWFDITKKVKTLKRTEFYAFHDLLTGALNRRYLEILDFIPQYLIFLDLDGFKKVNDSYGHTVGDILLKEVVERLQRVCKDELVIRVSGDEFYVLLKESNEESIFNLATDICQSLATPYKINGLTLNTVSCSCGLAKYTVDLDTTIRHADLAMYQSKALGKLDKVVAGIPRWYEEKMGLVYERQQYLANLLLESLEKKDFEIAFQPLVNLQELNETNPKKTPLLGYEVLCRWTLPTGQRVSPSEFIPIAEETGQITALTLIVLAKACQACKIVNDLSLPRPLQFSINISGQDLTNPRLKQSVNQIIRDSGVDPTLIKFEITESIISQLNVAQQVVTELLDHGVHSVLDDFGTKGSSLELMFCLSVSGIKIDKSFVDKWLSSVEHIIGLGHSKGLSVVCEGVETLEVAKFLRDAKADVGQGFLFGKPTTLSEVIDYWNIK